MTTKIDKCLEAVLEDFKKFNTIQRHEFHDLCTKHGCDAGNIQFILEGQHHLVIENVKTGRKSMGDIYKLAKVR